MRIKMIFINLMFIFLLPGILYPEIEALRNSDSVYYVSYLKTRTLRPPLAFWKRSDADIQNYLKARDEVLELAMFQSGSNLGRAQAAKAKVKEQIILWQDKLNKVIAVGEELNIQANGLIGYHRYFGRTFAQRMQYSRENLVNIIVEGRLRPATEYSGGAGTLHEGDIDEQGRLRDPYQLQAFVATLKTTAYGPYWILFKPEVIGSDRASGIPIEYHESYLVPELADRQALSDMIDAQVTSGKTTEEMAQAFKKKIITYDEFIAGHQEALQLHLARERHNKDLRQDIEKRIKNLQKKVKQSAGKRKESARHNALFIISNKNENPEVRWSFIGDYDPPEEPDFCRLLQTILSDPLESAEMKHYVLSFLTDPWHSPANTPVFKSIFTPQSLLHFVDPNNDPELRIAAIDVLAYFNEKVVIEKFMQLIHDENIRVRRYALYHFRFDSPETLNVCTEALQSQDPQDQLIALYVLRELPVVLPVPLLGKVKRIFEYSERLDMKLYALDILLREKLLSLLPDRPDLQQHPYLKTKSPQDLYDKLLYLVGCLATWDRRVKQDMQNKLHIKEDELNEIYRLLHLKLLDAIRAGDIVLEPFTEARINDLVLHLPKKDAMKLLQIKKIPAGGENASLYGFGYGISPRFEESPYVKKITVRQTGVEKNSLETETKGAGFFKKTRSMMRRDRGNI